jgi:hypothetical protein
MPNESLTRPILNSHLIAGLQGFAYIEEAIIADTRFHKFDYLIVNWRRLGVETHHFKHASGKSDSAK